MRAFAACVLVALLAYVVPVPLAAATSHSWEMADAIADVKPTMPFFGPGGGPFGSPLDAAPGLPGNAFADVLDITRVFVEGENETHFTLGMQVAGMDAIGYDLARQLFLGLQYQVSFRFSHDPDRRWEAFVNDVAIGPFTAGLRGGAYQLCWSTENDGDCTLRPGYTLDRATGTLRFLFEREEFAVGDGDAVRSLRPGDRLEAVVATSFAQGFGDRAPDVGESDDGFEFEGPSANDRLALVWESDIGNEDEEFNPFTFGPADADAYGVTPGVPATFPLHVVNRSPGKKIVSLAATVTAADPSAWNVTLAPTLVVGANDAVVLSVIVNPVGEVQHREFAKLRIRAAALGEVATVGVAETRLMATVTPTHDNNVLYFHVDEYEECIGDATLDRTCRDLFPFGWPLMNTVRDDAQYEDTPVALLGFEGGTSWVDFEMDTPLGADLRFDLAEGVIAVDPAFTARVGTTLRVAAYLSLDGEHIGAGEATMAIGSAPTPVHVEFAPALEASTLKAADGRLRVLLEVEDTRVSGVPRGDIRIGGLTVANTNVHLEVAASSLTLPLLALPPRTLSVSTGEHVVSLALKGGDDPEEYVNPAEGVLFNLSILNEGVVPDTIRMRVNATTPPGWSVQLLPGGTFALDPGESANATLAVRAPAGASEGDRATLELIANSSDDAVQATMRLVVVVTKGVDLPDESLGPVVKTKSGKKDSPGASPLLALALAGAALAAYRRRDD